MVMVVDEGDEFVLIQMTGDMTMDDIKKMTKGCQSATDHPLSRYLTRIQLIIRTIFILSVYVLLITCIFAKVFQA
jgi:CHASE3 domain sensor protein